MNERRIEQPPSPDDLVVAVPMGLLKLFEMLWDADRHHSDRLALQLLLEVVGADLVEGHLMLRVKAIHDLEDPGASDHLGTV